MELDRREIEARWIVNRALGVVASPFDDGTKQGMVDAVFDDAEGHRIAVEVTRVIDGRARAQRNEVAEFDVIPGITNAWYVRIGPVTRLTEVRCAIERVLSHLESKGVAEFDLDGCSAVELSDGERLLRGAGVRYVARWQGADPGTVMYAQSARVGVGSQPSEMADFLTYVINDGKRADNVRKLRDHVPADQRHLFIWLEYDHGLRWAPAFDRGIPAGTPAPDLPDGITHVWLAKDTGKWIAWFPDRGWWRGQ